MAPDIRPGRPLDDDWLFADPMSLDLTGDPALEPDPVEAASGRPGRLRWRFRLLAGAVIFAAGMLAGAWIEGVGTDPISVSATACPPSTAPLAGAAVPDPGRSG